MLKRLALRSFLKELRIKMPALGFGVQEKRMEHLRAIENERGLYQEALPPGQRMSLIKSLPLQAIVEEDLFASADELKEFLPGIRNNNILLDYLLKYSQFVNVDLLFLAFDCLEHNFENLDKYKAQALIDFQRNIKSYREERQIDNNAQIELPYQFLDRDEFQKQALYAIFMDKIVHKAIESALKEGFLLKAIVVAHLIAQSDSQFPGEKRCKLIDKYLRQAQIFSLEKLSEQEMENASLILNWLAKLLKTGKSAAIGKMAEKYLPKFKLFLAKGHSLLEPSATISIAILLHKNDKKVSLAIKRLFAEISERSAPHFKDQSLDNLFWLLLIYNSIPNQQSNLEVICFWLKSKISQGHLSEEIVFERIKKVFDLPNEPIFKEIKKQLITKFSVLKFSEPDLPYVSLLRFYFQSLIELNVVTRVRLSFISDYLLAIDQSSLDTQHFAAIYFLLTLYGHTSIVLAKNYLSPISQALSPKILLGSGPNANPGNKTNEDERDRSILNMFWAFTINTQIAFDLLKKTDLLENYSRLLKDFRKNFKKITCRDQTDLDKITQINYHIWLWKLSESLYIQPEDIHLPANRTSLDSLLSKAKGLSPKYSQPSFHFFGKSKVFVFESTIKISGENIFVCFFDEKYYSRILESGEENKYLIEANSLLRIKRNIFNTFKAHFIDVGINELIKSDFNFGETSKFNLLFETTKNFGLNSKLKIKQKLKDKYAELINNATCEKEESVSSTVNEKFLTSKELQAFDNYPLSDDEDY